MTKHDNTIATAEPKQPEKPTAIVGEPFAMADGCAILDGEHAPSVVLQCGNCERPFRIMLLPSGYKPCPHCKQEYTHLLLVCPVDCGTLVPEALELIADANYVDGDDDEPEVDDDQGDDGEPEDDQGDDEGK